MSQAVVDPNELRRFASSLKPFNDGIQSEMASFQLFRCSMPGAEVIFRRTL